MVTLIWCEDADGGIGLNNHLPWYIKEDMKHFRETTSGKIVVMGRKTYESIGRPLPNRKNIILTRNKNLLIDGCEIFNDIEDIINKYFNEDVFVLGGKEIYELFLPYAQKLIITKLEEKYKCDTRLNIKLDEFSLERKVASKEKNKLSFNYYKKTKIT